MRHIWIAVFSALMIPVLSACGIIAQPTEPTYIEETDQLVSSESIQSESTEAEETEQIPTDPAHSPLYIPGVTVEDVILYFNEVVLDSEIINDGDPSYVQKWAIPIYYSLEGEYTDEDIAVLNAFEDWLNGIEGFAGIYPAADPTARNMRICFCTRQELLVLMGPEFENMDGAVTFWYSDNKIDDAIICCRTDLDQELRNSVILEEVYNSLGPIQDTTLRPDSIIYQEFSQPQWLTPVDELILRLLYHPDILPGMNAQACEQVIRSLYY